MEFEDILLRSEEGIGFLSFNRPAQGNALRAQTLRELCAGIDALTRDDAVKVILLRAEGKHFSAGADLAFLDGLTTMEPAAVQSQVYELFQGAARRLYHCPKPTIALVSGFAVTVGCELALACDFRLVSETAKFQESWVRLGIMPPLGGLFLLPRYIGIGRAKQMVLRGEPLSAATAVETGLASNICAVEELDARGLELARELAQAAPLAYRSIKQALHRGLETSMEAEWSANVFNQAVLLSTADFREGLAAVKEKRKARFEGK